MEVNQEIPDYQLLLSKKLAEPETAKSLLNLIDRLDTVETALSGLEEMLQKLPQLIDSLQQESQKAQQLNEATRLLEKVAQPEILRALSGILDKAETIETVVSALDMFAEKAPEMIASAQDESGGDSRIREIMTLLDMLSQPEVLRNTSQILGNLDTIATLTSALGEAERKLPEIISSMHDESSLGRTIQQYMELAQKFSDDRVIANLNHLVDKIENLDAVLNILDEVVRNNPELKEPNSTTIRNINELFELLTKSMKDEEATILETARGGISILAEVNRILLSPKMEVIIKGMSAAMEYDKEDVPKVGPLGLIKMISDKNTQKTLGLISLLSHEIGGQLDYLDCNKAKEFEIKHKKGA